VKHYPARVLDAQIMADELFAEDDIKAELRMRLRHSSKAELARTLGIGTLKLSGILRGTWPIGDDVAAALGFRRVARFERIS
jgi:lambda repressor-like predicted transcriptional regulator